MKSLIKTCILLFFIGFISSCGSAINTNLNFASAQVSQKNSPYKYQNSNSSEMIKVAYQVVLKESKQLQAACNIYVLRVLELMGFSVKKGFLANDFDIYAKNTFRSYRDIKFTNADELKRHLWSYPERHGFIIQWKRANGPGHIAIVERVSEQLYVYQASLNKYHARIDKTSVEKLLLINGKRGLTVFSELQK